MNERQSPERPARQPEISTEQKIELIAKIFEVAPYSDEVEIDQFGSYKKSFRIESGAIVDIYAPVPQEGADDEDEILDDAVRVIVRTEQAEGTVLLVRNHHYEIHISDGEAEYSESLDIYDTQGRKIKPTQSESISSAIDRYKIATGIIDRTFNQQRLDEVNQVLDQLQ